MGFVLTDSKGVYSMFKEKWRITMSWAMRWDLMFLKGDFRPPRMQNAGRTRYVSLPMVIIEAAAKVCWKLRDLRAYWLYAEK